MIRPATTNDKSAILHLSSDSGLFPPDGLSELSIELDRVLGESPEQQHWLVLESGGRLTASAYYGQEPMTQGTWNLRYIAVLEAWKGRGLGSELLHHVENHLRDRAQRTLIIETSSLDGFELTRRFYGKHGYVQEARIRDFYGEGEDKVVFWKKL